MHRHHILILITVASVVIVLALPLYLKFIAYPGYEEFLVSSAEEEMMVLAAKMVEGNRFMTPISQEKPLPDSFIENVKYIKSKVGLHKIKIFTNDGIIVYSTNPADIGTRTTQSFFPEILNDGLPRTNLLVFKNAVQGGESQLIETYVPIFDHDIPIGVFEIYRDITNLRKALEKMKQHEQQFLLPIVIALLVGSLVSSNLAHNALTELRQAKDQFQHLSMTDALTCLLNRRGFTDLFAKQLAALQRSGSVAHLLFIDMNDFKLINDRFGHNVGDQALLEVAGIMRNTFRISDILGRIGGDEFAVLTIDGQDSLNEEQIKQRLLDNLAHWNSQQTGGYELFFSVGIVELPPSSDFSVDELMKRADAKMYAEKKRNKAT